MRFAVPALLALALVAPRALPQSSLPDLGGTADATLSPQMERKIGEEIVQEIRSRDPSYLDDPEVVDYLTGLGQKLVQANPNARQQFEFFAMKDHTINAFALPGGFVGVHTGLITLAETESELASVLGHEIAHVTQRHIARMLANEQQMQLPLMAAMAAAILFGRARPDLAAGAIAASQGAAVQSSLSYSRDFEREADRVGLQTLDAAGFDPRAMATFFEKLQRSSRVSDDSSVPGYLRTHPVTLERIADAQNKAAAMPYRQHLDSVDFYLVRAKLRADSGDAREAVASFDSAVRDGRYGSEAAARYGLATALMRDGKIKEAQAEMKRLRALNVSSAMIELLDVRLKRASGDFPGALQLLTKARARYPDSRAVAYADIGALQDAGRSDEALKAVADTMRAYPRDARLYGLQAKIYAAQGKRLLQHQALGEQYALQGSLPAAIEQLQLARSAGDGDFYQLSMIDARLKDLRARHAAEMADQKR